MFWGYVTRVTCQSTQFVPVVLRMEKASDDLARRRHRRPFVSKCEL